MYPVMAKAMADCVGELESKQVAWFKLEDLSEGAVEQVLTALKQRRTPSLSEMSYIRQLARRARDFKWSAKPQPGSDCTVRRFI